MPRAKRRKPLQKLRKNKLALKNATSLQTARFFQNVATRGNCCGKPFTVWFCIASVFATRLHTPRCMISVNLQKAANFCRFCRILFLFVYFSNCFVACGVCHHFCLCALFCVVAPNFRQTVRFRASCERYVVGNLPIVSTKNHGIFSSFTFVVDEAVVVCYNIFDNEYCGNLAFWVPLCFSSVGFRFFAMLSTAVFCVDLCFGQTHKIPA